MSPHWLFFPTVPSEYIYECQTDRSVIRGSASTTARVQDSTGTESGDLVDQFAPFATNTQFRKVTNDRITFSVQSNDTSTPGFETISNINSNITNFTITVGGNTLVPDSSVSVAGKVNARPIFTLTTTGGAAGTFWTDNNLDDTDNITITVTLTF